MKIHNFEAGSCMLVGMYSLCIDECVYEVSTSHLHDNPLQIGFEYSKDSCKGYPCRSDF